MPKCLSSLLCRRRALSRAKQAACYKVWTCSDAKKVISDAVGDHRFFRQVFLLLIWTRTSLRRQGRSEQKLKTSYILSTVRGMLYVLYRMAPGVRSTEVTRYSTILLNYYCLYSNKDCRVEHNFTVGYKRPVKKIGEGPRIVARWYCNYCCTCSQFFPRFSHRARSSRHHSRHHSGVHPPPAPRLFFFSELAPFRLCQVRERERIALSEPV